MDSDQKQVSNQVPDDELRRKTVSDWQISGKSSLQLQRQLDDMARWYLLNHKDFIVFAKNRDAAIQGKEDAYVKDELLSYPGVKAIAAHEIAHHLYKNGGEANKILARKLAEAAHSQTGIDIHPGTEIGRNCFLDHGTGDVIGETAKIGNNSMIYHGVTLGAYGKAADSAHRHPEIGDNCTISVGANVLGNVKIGNDVTILPSAQLRGNNIKIGNDVRIGASAQIGDGNIIGGGVQIGDGVIIPKTKKVRTITTDELPVVYKNGDIKMRGIPANSQIRWDEDGKLHIDSVSYCADKISQIDGKMGNVEALIAGIQNSIQKITASLGR